MLKASKSRWSYTDDMVKPMVLTSPDNSLKATPAPESSLKG